MSNTRVLVEVADGVARVRMNRADKRNGLDFDMFAALVDAGERLRDDPSVRAVVLSGEGPAFCAGLDWGAFLSREGGGLELFERPEGSPANRAQRTAWVWREVPVPVIAAVQGACFGGGLQIALGADIRIVHPEAQLSVMEIRWGLIPDMALSKTLVDIVPLDIAKELTFTGRRVSGEEAVALGLATRVADDPVAEALALARTIAGNSPHAIRAGKAMLDGAADRTVGEALLEESRLQKELLGSSNQLEAVQANLAKRPPVFRDPT